LNRVVLRLLVADGAAIAVLEADMEAVEDAAAELALAASLGIVDGVGDVVVSCAAFLAVVVGLADIVVSSLFRRPSLSGPAATTRLLVKRHRQSR
jgi:hypothetical protein